MPIVHLGRIVVVSLSIYAGRCARVGLTVQVAVRIPAVVLLTKLYRTELAYLSAAMLILCLGGSKINQLSINHNTAKLNFLYYYLGTK